MKRALRRDPPDALVVIDAGAFNVPLARWVKAAAKSVPVFYYFPPGSWRKNVSGAPRRRKQNLATVDGPNRDAVSLVGRPCCEAGGSGRAFRRPSAAGPGPSGPARRRILCALRSGPKPANRGFAARQPAGRNPAHSADAFGSGGTRSASRIRGRSIRPRPGVFRVRGSLVEDLVRREQVSAQLQLLRIHQADSRRRVKRPSRHFDAADARCWQRMKA